MSKRTIEIEDTLQGCVDSAIEQIKEALIEYLDANRQTDETPDWGDLDYSGTLHEIIDGSVPIYTAEIRDIFYLHGDEIEEAFDNAGLGPKEDANWPSGWKAAAIYCYIEQEAAGWFHDNAEEVFDEWKQRKDEQNSDSAHTAKLLDAAESDEERDAILREQSK